MFVVPSPCGITVVPVTSRLTGRMDLTLLYLGIALYDNVSSFSVTNLISGCLNFIL